MTVLDRSELRRALADLDAEDAEARHRHPLGSGCRFCGVSHSYPARQQARLARDLAGAPVIEQDPATGEVSFVFAAEPPWHHVGADLACWACWDELSGPGDDGELLRVRTLLALIGERVRTPAVESDPAVKAAPALRFFAELPAGTPPSPTPWAHADQAALRAAYEAARVPEDPAYLSRHPETGEPIGPCEDCGSADRWVLHERVDVSSVTKVFDSGERVEDDPRIEHVVELRCAPCLTRGALAIAPPPDGSKTDQWLRQVS